MLKNKEWVQTFETLYEKPFALVLFMRYQHDSRAAVAVRHINVMDINACAHTHIYRA